MLNISTIGALAAVAAAVIAAGAAIVSVAKWGKLRWREYRDRKALRHLVGADRYDSEEIKRSTAYYIHPDCQSVDPSGAEDFRRVVSTREPLFNAVDRLVQNPGQQKFVILLADSGMGKTSFLLNYYTHHWQSRRRKPFKLSVIPLNLPDCDRLISTLDERNETVLCLDALDEDRRAVQDHRKRIGELAYLTQGFRTVIITCRTQFFPKDEEIPTETGVLKVGAVGANEERLHYFHKLYLAPFTDRQVQKYLKRRFPIWRYRQRRAARSIVAKIHDLAARPMLLAHVPDLVNVDSNKIDYSYQIYETMVTAWLEREKGFIQDSRDLRDFSECLAVDLLINRGNRQMERISGSELKPLAHQYGINLEAWQLRGRSLLNRDASGNYKFAHRSIMEYLFVRGFLKKGAPQRRQPWTDLSKAFLCEMIRSKGADIAHLHWADRREAKLDDIAHLHGADLREAKLDDVYLPGVDLSGAKLGMANFEYSHLREADLNHSFLREANLSGAYLSNADLSCSFLRKADLCGAWLHDANLSGADLCGADLSRADLRGANLSGANLRGARGLTKKQIACAIINSRTKLDDLPYYEDPTPGKVDIARLRDCVGTYERAPGITLKVSREGDMLYSTRTRGEPWQQLLARQRLVPETADVFFRPGHEGRRLFRRNDSGKVDALIDRRNNEDVIWRKL